MPVRLALLVVGLLVGPTVCSATSPAPGATGKEMAEAATKFIDALDADQHAKGVIAFDDPARLDWHNIPKPQRKGLQLRDLTSEQRTLCHRLLQVALSKDGYAKAVNILALENNLREGEKNLPNGHLRDPLRYFLTIFGEPGGAGSWGWSFEGHHFSLNFVIRDARVVADTPSFWGANPATVKTFVENGPKAGTRTLADEEQLAFELLDSLDPSQRAIAVASDEAPAEYRAAGKPQPPQTAPEGIAAAELREPQKKMLRGLLAAYCGHLTPELARARIDEIEARGLDRVHFAWYGAQQPGVGHAYRVQGPTFILELVNVQSDPAGNPANHIHSVWRSLEGDFGVGG